MSNMAQEQPMDVSSNVNVMEVLGLYYHRRYDISNESCRVILTQTMHPLLGVFDNDNNNQLLISIYNTKGIIALAESERLRNPERFRLGAMDWSREFMNLIRERHDVGNAINTLINIRFEDPQLTNYQEKIRDVFRNIPGVELLSV